MYWFTPQLPKCQLQLGLGQAKAQEPRTQSKSPVWVAETNVLEPSFAATKGVH